MTPDVLVNDLKAEIAAIFTGFTLKDSEGNQVPLNVYAFDTPIRLGEDMEDTEETHELPEPYVVVEVNSGNIASETDPQVVTAVCVICVYDDSSGRQGPRDVLHIINKIYERFAKNPCLGSAMVKYPIDWVLQEEDNYPYYLGGIQMPFEIPAVIKEDPLA